ncbi:MAG: branched-chain amino acid ABC transporter permease [Candidatus Methanodesulfokora sp.]
MSKVEIISLGTLISALTWSSILSLMTIGITLLYRTTKVPNFAHASFVTTGVYSATIVSLMGFHPYLGMFLGFILGGLEGLVLFYAILEPLRRRRSSIFILMIATLSYDILLYGLLNVLADDLQTTYKILARMIYYSRLDFSIGGVPGVAVISLLALITTVILLYILLNRTTLGVALRACMENTALAQTLGINVSLMLLFSWFIAGGIAGVAGALLPFYTMCGPYIGMLYIAEMFCASILGGLDQIYGAPLGGFLIGFAKVALISVLASFVGPWITEYAPIIPLAAMAVALVLVPKGLVAIKIRRG